MTLPSRELVNQIIRAKNAFSYLSTNDLDSRLLDQKTISRVPPNEKIFINNALSGAKYKRFLVLKSKAKDLRYKYIWHKAGKFLIRRGDKDKHVRVIETVVDLSVNSGAYQRGKRLSAAALKVDPS